MTQPYYKTQATLRAQAEAKEREQQEVLECTFQPQNFTAQTYHPPHDRPRRHLHACPHPASARPPMTVPAVAPVAAAAAAADSHRAFSSLSPQRQRGAAADTSGVVTDVNMSPRT